MREMLLPCALSGLVVLAGCFGTSGTLSTKDDGGAGSSSGGSSSGGSSTGDSSGGNSSGGNSSGGNSSGGNSSGGNSSGGASGGSSGGAASGGTAGATSTGGVGAAGGCQTQCCVDDDCPTRANADAACDEGQCVYDCDANYADCDGIEATGCEVDLRVGQDAGNTVQHCGGCGAAYTCTSLSGLNASASCVAGECTAECVADTSDQQWRDCDGEYETGCEINVLSDPDNCGTCEKVCEYVNPEYCPNEEDACIDGACYGRFTYVNSYYCPIELPRAAIYESDCGGGCYYSCGNGFYDCDHEPSNGCESSNSDCQPFPYFIYAE